MRAPRTRCRSSSAIDPRSVKGRRHVSDESPHLRCKLRLPIRDQDIADRPPASFYFVTGVEKQCFTRRDAQVSSLGNLLNPVACVTGFAALLSSIYFARLRMRDTLAPERRRITRTRSLVNEGAGSDAPRPLAARGLLVQAVMFQLVDRSICRLLSAISVQCARRHPLRADVQP
jgi:hypothetical protein